MSTLLDRALEAGKSKIIPSKSKYSLDDRLDLALSMLSGEISAAQAAEAMGCGTSSIRSRLAYALWQGIKHGLLSVRRKKSVTQLQASAPESEPNPSDEVGDTEAELMGR